MGGLTQCRVCKSSKYRIYKIIGQARIVRCAGCGLLYVNPVICPEEKQLYNEDYYTQALGKPDSRCVESIELEIQRNNARVKELTDRFQAKGSLLDVGCGQGFFLAALKRAGWSVCGIDASKWAVLFAREKLGLNVFSQDIETVCSDKKFDVVTMFHVLEHVEDPIKMLKDVSLKMENKGWLVIKGPNFSSFDRFWHSEKWRPLNEDSHLSHFVPQTYALMLKKSGFTLRKIEYQWWNPLAHFIEAGFGDGLRADHSPDIIDKKYNELCANLFFRISAVFFYNVSRMLCLRGRDLTIYAQKA